jgi:colanic acid biosynthesis glycosyl transferase WcaI
MKILLHDFGAYSFPWQLAKQLHQRGHEIAYRYSAAEPKRCNAPEDNSGTLPPGLSSSAIVVPQALKRESPFDRRLWSRKYGVALAHNIRTFRPDVVLSANTPLDSQNAALKESKRIGVKFVFWLQDILSVATRNILTRRRPLLGSLAGWYYERMERQLLSQSDEVIIIASDFYQYTDRWQIPRSRVHVIENWSPLEDVPMLMRDNRWAKAHGTENALCIMYAGQLGLKHNPMLLGHLAQSLKGRADVRLVIMAEGPGVAELQQLVASEQLNNVHFLPFQPYAELPYALASADVLVAVLDGEGGSYCVPSKILTYMCSGRPILLSISRGNLAAQIIERQAAGLVVAPNDLEGFVRAAEQLLSNSLLRTQLGHNARLYAETHFDIERLTDRFENIMFQSAADHTVA